MPASSSTPGQRITQLIQYLGLTKNAFAQSLGKTATVIQHLVDERNKPGFDLLCKVFEVYPNVSRDWLLLGAGPMLLTANTHVLFAEAAPEVVPDAVPPAADFEGIDLTEVPDVPRRRAGSLLQPADIAATLALAGQHNGHRRPAANGTLRDCQPNGSGPAPAAPVMPAAAALVADAAPPTPVAAPVAASSVAPPLAAAPAPDPAYLAAALHTMQLQHQLALAEQRNQHLLEQQVLLRQLVEVLQRTT